jgi:AAA+ ATPase superfamily predicted ATPase
MNINPSVFSDIQNIWDSTKDDSRVNLMVSGSVHSLMHKIFMTYKEPLYGRANSIIRLSPFPVTVLKQIMLDHAPNYQNDDLLALYAFTGGVPKYVELLMDGGAVTKEAMIEHMVRENSVFIEEGNIMLIQEFGKKYGKYYAILAAIASGANDVSRIADATGQKSLGGSLQRLEEDYGLISKLRPIKAKEGSQTVKYEIKDHFLRFWFRYVEKNQRLIEIGQYPALRRIMEDDYETYSGDVLERYFKLKLVESMEYRDIGGWWDPKGYTDKEGHHQQAELDIVALRLKENVLDVIEVKRNPDKFNKGLLEEKTAYFSSKEKQARKNKIVLSSLSLDDM